MIPKGKGDRSVAIIMAYRPCKTTFDNAGDTTCYMQKHHSILAHYNETGHQLTSILHCQFILDLQAWIGHLRADKTHIILSMDGNEDTSKHQGIFYPLTYQNREFIHAPNHDGSLSTLASTCGLIDTLAHFHPPPYPSTYSRGKSPLNYIYVSDNIIHSIDCSGVLLLYSIFLGDHNLHSETNYHCYFTK
jgi:hypothetical protein